MIKFLKKLFNVSEGTVYLPTKAIKQMEDCGLKIDDVLLIFNKGETITVQATKNHRGFTYAHKIYPEYEVRVFYAQSKRGSFNIYGVSKTPVVHKK